MCLRKRLTTCNASARRRQRRSIVIVVMMTMPAAMAAMIVPPALVAIAVSITVIDGCGCIDCGRRRFIDDRRLLDVHGRGNAERHADIDMSERYRRRTRGDEARCANECQAFQLVAPFRASADECHSLASDAILGTQSFSCCNRRVASVTARNGAASSRASRGSLRDRNSSVWAAICAPCVSSAKCLSSRCTSAGGMSRWYANALGGMNAGSCLPHTARSGG